MNKTYPKRVKVKNGVAELCRARKVHRCKKCPMPIKPGDLYYCVYYGMGLGARKFPDRVCVNCIKPE